MAGSKRRARERPPAPIVEKTARGLVPLAAYDSEVIDKMPIGATFDLISRKKRSDPQQGLYWLLLDKVVEATGAWPASEYLHEVLVRDAGFVRPVLDPIRGRYIEVRDSTSFDAMEHELFNRYMTTALARLSEWLGFDVTALLPAKEGS
jgi:hypothetical protein